MKVIKLDWTHISIGVDVNF